MGKTTLGLTISRHVAKTTTALFLTQEVPREQLQDCLLAAEGNIDLDKVLQPDAADGELWERLTEGAERCRELNLLIDDQPSLRLTDVRLKILAGKREALKAGSKLSVVVVDYIQLMRGEGENRSVQIGTIANGLKALAITYGVAIVVLAQCNREADKKPDGADSMSDINESGGVEAAADVVALIHREFVRNNDLRLKDFGELRIVKNRIGAVGRVSVFFNGARQFMGSWSGPAPTAAPITGGGGHSRKKGFD